MSLITEADRKLLAEVKTDPKAYELLKHKCRWEAMSLHAVLHEWGDPRTWPSYSRPTQEKP